MPDKTYESPTIQGPFQLYETPMLLDIEDAASCDWGCATSGDAAPTPIEQQQV